MQSTVGLSYRNNDSTLYNQATSVPPSNRLNCNGSCIIDTITCSIKPTFCYIEGKCYEGYQTRLNGDLSCLQCQPDKDQRNWGFNRECSAGEKCVDPIFIGQNLCPSNIIQAFYTKPTDAILIFYNFTACSRDRIRCEEGFFISVVENRTYSCCPGHFCPQGQTCMIPCRKGEYCPGELSAINGTCRAPVNCPENYLKEYGPFGCGGSYFEGFCPSGMYCPTPTENIHCKSCTDYCPIGVTDVLSQPMAFVFIKSRVGRQLFCIIVFTTVTVIIFALGICVRILERKNLKKSDDTRRSVDLSEKSEYFRGVSVGQDTNQSDTGLNIYLTRVKLRDVTCFNPEINGGFTGSIAAGEITALMGGSGCGKSSLLETIYGRRQLGQGGSITFANHQPLSNILTDYVGYVPQVDIMHNDLTVFETVYYSARARRLNKSKETLINDVRFVLQTLGLDEMCNKFVKTLSGGQRKRVNVAMEVVACPKVLLLDEPTSGLDTVACDHLFDLLRLIRSNDDGLVTIIIVIHQPSHELFQRIDRIFFLTPSCCLAYQGPRSDAMRSLIEKIGSESQNVPPRHNECDTCFIILSRAVQHLQNHNFEQEPRDYSLTRDFWLKRAWYHFYYVLRRSIRQIYVRGSLAEAVYMFAYLLLGTCVGFLFENKFQAACNISKLTTLYFLITLSFGILTCVSSQRLFGVEITDQTFQRESRNYYHPFQYWLAKSLVDIFRMIIYPLLFLIMLYIMIVPRGAFYFYLMVMLLCSFTCSGIGQLASVMFNRTEYAYLAGTIIALLSCLLSGFSPTKQELGEFGIIVPLSFSRHVQNLLFQHESKLYLEGLETKDHIWGTPVEGVNKIFEFDTSKKAMFWIISIEIFVRILTLLFLYGKSEYRSTFRFRVTNFKSIITRDFKDKLCQNCCSKRADGSEFQPLNNETNETQQTADIELEERY